MEKTEKIHAYLARAGVASRRASEKLVETGRVFVNGKPAKVGDRVSEKDRVEFDGKQVFPAKHAYYLLHKPAGYISSNTDPHFSQTIFDLLPQGKRLFTVGRLDAATEGMLLVTNDGQFAAQVSHPSHEVQKTYKVLLNRVLTEKDMQQIAAGITLEDQNGQEYQTQGVIVRLTQKNAKSALITLHQGKNRIVRKIFQKLGYRVVRLIRVQIGALTLEDLPRGSFRALTPEDRKKLLS